MPAFALWPAWLATLRCWVHLQKLCELDIALRSVAGSFRSRPFCEIIASASHIGMDRSDRDLGDGNLEHCVLQFGAVGFVMLRGLVSHRFQCAVPPTGRGTESFR